jgi:hypothetical protein
MKNIKTTIAILALFLITVSCSKKDDEVTPAPITNPFPVENFLNGFLTSTGFNQETTNQLSTFGYYNYGTVFKPKVNGTINSVAIKLPSSDGDVVVRIWKVSTQALLKSFSVIVATNNLEVTTSIDKLPLLKDEEYIITMKVNSWFDRKKTNGSSISFPVDINNIKITGFISDSQNNFPSYIDRTDTSIYHGDISFNFKQTQ